jgi:hypothetical protein
VLFHVAGIISLDAAALVRCPIPVHKDIDSLYPRDPLAGYRADITRSLKEMEVCVRAHLQFVKLLCCGRRELNVQWLVGGWVNVLSLERVVVS